MFYDKFILLCRKKGVSPSRAAVDAGFAKSLISKWKSNPNIIPSPDVLNKISNYFNVPISVLLGENDSKKTSPEGETYTKGEELILKLYRDIPEEMRPVAIDLLQAVSKKKKES